MIPKPTQISGARFLAERQYALLADAPRVGKTGASIIAADLTLDENILVVTTASGRPVWKRAFPQWSTLGRSVEILGPAEPKAQVVIAGWPSIASKDSLGRLLARRWNRIILDESHYAKNVEAKRTQAVYGDLLRGAWRGLTSRADGVWCLTGTPIPNAPNDLYPMMRALCPERLAASGDWPDVTSYAAFMKRYCKVKPKKIGRGAYARYIDVVIGGRNLEELRARLDGFMLRRTQEDVGISAPVYELMPLEVKARVRAEIEASADHRKILEVAEAGTTKDLEMHLGPLRRLTGEIKAKAVVEAIREEFECGLDKIVLMAWHTDVIHLLRDGLAAYGVVGIDGSTPAKSRGAIEQQFLNDPDTRVFVGQIQAAGEAIDLSSAAELVFVEPSFTPKDMAQAALRVTNHGQDRQVRVRVAALEGSIDEALQAILMRKWSAIREVLSP